MSKKYQEIMDQVRVTDEMKQRVLQNVKEQMEAERTEGTNAGSRIRMIQKQETGKKAEFGKKPESGKKTEFGKTPESGKIMRSRFLSYGRTSRYLSAAACIMMLLVGGLTVTKLLNRGAPVNPTEPAVGMMPGETLASSETEGKHASQDEAGGEVGAMVGNDMVEVDSLAELSQALGFPVPEVKNIPFEVTGVVYTNGWNEFAQVEYRGGASAEEVMFRKAKGSDDISGDYNTYTDVKEITVNDVSVTLKGDRGIYSLATWQQDKFTYSLCLESGGSEDAFVSMIQSIP